MQRLLTSAPIRAITVALLVCVLALRVAIPSGYMFDQEATGWPRLVACPADSPVPKAMAAMPGKSGHATHKHRHQGSAADHPCAFAAASAAVDLAALPAPLLLPAEQVEPAALLYLFARPGLGLAAPPPPKTGPPALA